MLINPLPNTSTSYTVLGLSVRGSSEKKVFFLFQIDDWCFLVLGNAVINSTRFLNCVFLMNKKYLGIIKVFLIDFFFII